MMRKTIIRAVRNWLAVPLMAIANAAGPRAPLLSLRLVGWSHRIAGLAVPAWVAERDRDIRVLRLVKALAKLNTVPPRGWPYRMPTVGDPSKWKM
jgi:hypothetical protein